MQLQNVKSDSLRHGLSLVSLLVLLSGGQRAHSAVTASAYLAGFGQKEFTGTGEFENVGNNFITRATIAQQGNWQFALSTFVGIDGFSFGLQEASAQVSVTNTGHMSGNPIFPGTLTVTGHLSGFVEVGTNSFHDGSLTFGQSQINSLDALFFPDSGMYVVNFPLATTVPVDSQTGAYPVNFSFRSESWGRVGVTQGGFRDTLVVTSVLLPNGNTPESEGWTLSFENGITSPNVPPPIPGDYNNNGTVDASDYVVWRKHQGTSFQLTNEVADVTPGQVTQHDYDAWRARFGNSTGDDIALAIPEPSTSIALSGLCLIAIPVSTRMFIPSASSRAKVRICTRRI